MEKVKKFVLSALKTTGSLLGVGYDKVLHFVCSLGVVLLIGVLTSPEIGVTAGLFIGIGKEIGDEMCPDNRWSWGDIVADCLGVVVGMLILF